MKTKSIAIIGIIALMFMLFGCTNTQTTANLGGIKMDTNISDNSGITNTDSNTKITNNINETKKAKNGDNVKVDYTGKLTDGTVFDSSIGKTPLEFTVGAGQMIKGFDLAIVGMIVGETKIITLPPEQAYGAYDPNKVKIIDINSFGKVSTIQTGTYVTMTDGMYQYRGKIMEVNDKNVTIDFNPELAGKTLIFEVKLVAIE